MSTALAPPVATHGRALLASIAAQIHELGALSYCQVAGEEVLELARTTQTAARLLYAVQVSQTDEIDRRSMAAAASCASTASLLRQMLRISAHEARSRVRAARSTQPQDLPSGGEIPSELPVLGAAVDGGLLDRSHVEIVISTMGHLRAGLADDVRVEAEQQLVAYATDLDPDQFRKVAAHLAEVLDPDGGLDQDAAAARAEFTIGVRNGSTGLTPISGRLDDLSIETLRVAIDGLAAPRPALDGVSDPRPAAVRRAHALIDVIRRAVDHTDLPSHGGRRPQITVTVPWDLAGNALGTAISDSGATLTPQTVRQLLCDAEIIPAVLGSDSQVLDLGRTTRTFSHAIRRAITVRDRGCAFPGCDRPPSWTDVHHLRFWTRDLGPTSSGNGCLLCPYHHSEIHRERWLARMSMDGIPRIRPATLDRPRATTAAQHRPPPRAGVRTAVSSRLPPRASRARPEASRSRPTRRLSRSPGRTRPPQPGASLVWLRATRSATDRRAMAEHPPASAWAEQSAARGQPRSGISSGPPAIRVKSSMSSRNL